MAATAEPVARAPVHFVEAIRYFEGKTNIPTNSWSDLMHGAHARAWSVAGATSDALLTDLYGAMRRGIAEGGTLEQFRASFDEIVARHGWSYRGGRNWRTRVIFQTNTRMAYAAGRWDQAQRLKATRPYLRYVAVQDGRTRPEHRGWHDTVLHVDHPFWLTHFPPNGWNCRCTVMSLSERDLRRYGLRISEAPKIEMQPRRVQAPDGSWETVWTPEGIDTGFGYNPGDSWLSGAVPEQQRLRLPEPTPIYGPMQPAAGTRVAPYPPHDLPPLPARPAPDVPILPPGLSDEEYVEAFLGEFGDGVGRPVMIRDASGARITISEEMFRSRSGAWKVRKGGRERYLRVLAATLRDPDEIWLVWSDEAQPGAPPRWVLRRRYVSRFDLRTPDGRPARGALSILEWGAQGWDGITTYAPDTGRQIDGLRAGVLLYRRPGL